MTRKDLTLIIRYFFRNVNLPLDVFGNFCYTESMKRTLFTGVASIILTLCLLFCGCSSFTGIHTAYEKEGFEEANPENYREMIESYTGGGFGESFVTHVFVRETEEESINPAAAIILEFPSDDALVSFADASAVLKEKLGELTASGRICGNCLLIYAESEKEELLFVNSR